MSPDTQALEALLRDRALRLTPEAMKLIASRNEAGMGALMPYAEMVIAAEELQAMGLVEWQEDGRWLTAAGRAALKEVSHA